MNPPDPPDAPRPPKWPSTFLAALVAVFWSFFGVRKQADHERSALQLKPQHYLMAALLAAALFIGLLLLVVHVVLSLVHP